MSIRQIFNSPISIIGPILRERLDVGISHLECVGILLYEREPTCAKHSKKSVLKALIFTSIHLCKADFSVAVCKVKYVRRFLLKPDVIKCCPAPIATEKMHHYRQASLGFFRAQLISYGICFRHPPRACQLVSRERIRHAIEQQRNNNAYRQQSSRIHVVYSVLNSISRMLPSFNSSRPK